MVIRLIILLSLIALCAQAQTTVFNTDNNVSDLNPERDALSAPAGTIRITANINNGGETLDLSTAALPIPLAVTHRTDGWTSPIAPALETVAAEGRIRWQFSLQPGEYELIATATFSNDEYPVFWRYLSVTSQVSAAAVVNISATNNISADVNITNVFTNTQINVSEAVITGAVFNASNNFAPTNINNITINDPTEFITANHTSTPQSVRIWGGTNLATSVVAGANMDIYVPGGTGGSGDVTINGVTTNNWTFTGQYPLIVSNVGNMAYFGLSSFEGGAIFLPDLTTTVIVNYVSATNQSYIVPGGVTQLYVWAWGGGGGGGFSGAIGGGGGHSFATFPVTPTEVLDLYIGGGGGITATSVTFATVGGGFPDGGLAVSRTSSRSGGGGGSTSVRRGTNVVLVAGGGGGASGYPLHTSGSGGGLSGSSGTAAGGSTGGGGGTQTQGGGTGSTAIPLAWTNTAGDKFFGGSAGSTTNLTVTGGAGGGGGGWFGGGGGLVAGAINNNGAAGGGGSGYINTDVGAVGYTVRAVGQTPAGQEVEEYQSSWGVGGVTAEGRNGGMIIKY